LSHPVYLRCYTSTHGSKPHFEPEIDPKANSSIDFALDVCVDKAKKLAFGTCGIWIDGKLFKTFVFYADDAKESEISQLHKICSAYPVEVLSKKEFVENVFFPYVFRARAKCIGFELPFVLSRLATEVTESRRYPNGFSFTLSQRAKHPHIVIKSIDSKSQFIQFNKTFRKKKSQKITYYRGGFIDCKTLAFVLTNDKYDLESALEDFECPIRIIESKKQEISEQNIKVSINNLFAYHILYKQQMKRYEMFCIPKQEHNLVSPASIGKAYLEKIGIKSFLEQNPQFPKELLGYVLSTYYGGIVDARIRVPTLVTNLDFASMYPTLFVLFGMYRLLIAEKIMHHTSTKETQDFLDRITIRDINKPETWPKMITICKVMPDGDILPIRSTYDKTISSIALSYLTSKDGTALWYTMPDLIASKIRTGKTPKILEAITFVPVGAQSGLREITLPNGMILAKKQDLIKKIIEERFRIKNKLDKLEGNEKKQAELVQKILKIIANSTSYGISVQINTRKTILQKKVTVYGLDKFDTETQKIENAGPFFNPIISVFLTAGSRLILATVEKLLEQNNGYLAYCDTDAVFVSPQHTELIQEFFRKLSPYSENTELFKIQKENGKDLKNVLVYAISPKRYVIYEKKGSKITIYKYSNHALGHLLGMDHEQFWRDIILLRYNPEKEQEILAEYETKYAMSELAITNYDFFRRFGVMNEGKPYSEMVKPYDSVLIGNAYRKDRKSGVPIVPFVHKIENLDEVPFGEFIDYKSGILYPNSDSLDSREYWKPMSKSFSEYREYDEKNSENILQRKHLMFGKDSVKYVGKEINELESSTVLGVSKEDSIEYENQDEKIRMIIEILTEEKARQLGIPRRTYFDWKKKLRNDTALKLKGMIKARLLDAMN